MNPNSVSKIGSYPGAQKRRAGMVEQMSDIWTEDSVARVVSQFKDSKTLIERSFQESDDFRSLCEDYAVCARALENWQVSTAAKAAQRQQEYTELLTELGKDIHEWLEYHRK